MKLFKILTTSFSMFISLVLIGSGICFANDVIKLGVAGAHSGNFGKYGITILRAAQMYVDEINSQGGVLGKKVKLIAEDDKCNNELAAKVAKMFVAEGVHLVLGHMCTPSTWSALETYTRNKKIAISPSSTDPGLTQGKYPNFYRTVAPDDIEAKLQVDLALNKLGLRKIAIVYDISDYGKVLANYVKLYLAKDRRAKVVLFKKITPGKKDYSKVIKKIDRSKADAVIYEGYYLEASKILMEMRKKNMKTLFISDKGVKDDEFIKVAGKFAEGVYVSGRKKFKNDPMPINIRRAYKRLYGTNPAGSFFYSSYAAAQIAIAAIENAGSTDYDALTKVLHNHTFFTVLGEIRFDKNGDAIGVGHSIFQVKNGSFVEYK